MICVNLFIHQIDCYICGDGCDVPLLLLGGAGSGKSSIMAKIADMAALKALENKIPGYVFDKDYNQLDFSKHVYYFIY